MKKITIALFAIMLTAGFAMAQVVPMDTEDVGVIVNVATYASMSYDADMVFNIAVPGVSVTEGFTVTASSNYLTTIDYAVDNAWPSGLSQVALGTDLSQDTVNAMEAGQTFPKTLELISDYTLDPSIAHNNNISVTLN